MDPSVFRSYNDTEDANMQRDLNSRAVYGGISTPMSVSGTTHHLIPVTRARAQELHNTIGNKVRNNDFSLTPEQRELTWLATIGKVFNESPTQLVPINQIIEDNIIRNLYQNNQVIKISLAS